MHKIFIPTAPTPSLVISSNIPNPIRPIGSAVTLTCTMELSLTCAVDVPVTVNTSWTGPAGFMRTGTAQPAMGSTIIYTSTVVVSSFGTDQSGNYTCKVTVEIKSSFFMESVGYASSKITVCKIMISFAPACMCI